MNELKRCPFCGGKAVTSTFLDWDDLECMPIEVNDSESIDGEVTCENERCINGWWLSQKEWNTRPIEDALNARIAELELGLNNQTVHSNTLQKILTEKLDRIAELEATVEIHADISNAYEKRISEIVSLSNKANAKLQARIAELEAERLELRKILGWAYDLDEYKDNPEERER